MALCADDKLLGERVHNYCSSSEDESNYEDAEESFDISQPSINTGQDRLSQPAFPQYQRFSTNTGPKGVINDWREYKRLESENRERNERERKSLAKKLSMTCRSHLNDEEEKRKDESLLDDIGQLDDEFLQEYRLKRIEEMRRALHSTPLFGEVLHLDSQNYVEAIDQEQSSVTIVVHIFNEKVAACVTMDTCFSCLARDYPNVKFCKISARDARLSLKFAIDGVPAILVYKDKQLVGNFIQLALEFGDEFSSSDIESFLIEHAVLSSDENVSSSVRDRCQLTSLIAEVPDDDSDVD